MGEADQAPEDELNSITERLRAWRLQQAARLGNTSLGDSVLVDLLVGLETEVQGAIEDITPDQHLTPTDIGILNYTGMAAEEDTKEYWFTAEDVIEAFPHTILDPDHWQTYMDRLTQKGVHLGFEIVWQQTEQASNTHYNMRVVGGLDKLQQLTQENPETYIRRMTVTDILTLVKALTTTYYYRDELISSYPEILHPKYRPAVLIPKVSAYLDSQDISYEWGEYGRTGHTVHWLTVYDQPKLDALYERADIMEQEPRLITRFDRLTDEDLMSLINALATTPHTYLSLKNNYEFLEQSRRARPNFSEVQTEIDIFLTMRNLPHKWMHEGTASARSYQIFFDQETLAVWQDLHNNYPASQEEDARPSDDSLHSSANKPPVAPPAPETTPTKEVEPITGLAYNLLKFAINNPHFRVADLYAIEGIDKHIPPGPEAMEAFQKVRNALIKILNKRGIEAAWQDKTPKGRLGYSLIVASGQERLAQLLNLTAEQAATIMDASGQSQTLPDKINMLLEDRDSSGFTLEEAFLELFGTVTPHKNQSEALGYHLNVFMKQGRLHKQLAPGGRPNPLHHRYILTDQPKNTE